MGTALNRWEDWEREKVIYYVEKYPHNMSEAFEHAADALPGRTKAAVSFHYYQTIKPMLDKNNIVVTAQGSRHGLMANTKNVPRKKIDGQLQMVVKMVDRLPKDKRQDLALHIFDSLNN
jgi:hypothetical protein